MDYLQIESSRIYVFLLALTLFSGLEFFFHYRSRVRQRKKRWVENIGMIVISSIVLKLAIPGGLAAIFLMSQKMGIGLFFKFSLPLVLKMILSVVILDFLIYVQHVLTHKIDFLWRFHIVHHSDPDLDATSALRFHPVEMLLSLFYKAVFVFFLGIDPISIVIFEIILNFMAMFNHSNLRLPKIIEKMLRLMIVTPQMHIIHHSIVRSESDTNYGFNLSIWDRLFSTYRETFADKKVIGVKGQQVNSLIGLLLWPFKKTN